MQNLIFLFIQALTYSKIFVIAFLANPEIYVDYIAIIPFVAIMQATLSCGSFEWICREYIKTNKMKINRNLVLLFIISIFLQYSLYHFLINEISFLIGFLAFLSTLLSYLLKLTRLLDSLKIFYKWIFIKALLENAFIITFCLVSSIVYVELIILAEIFASILLLSLILGFQKFKVTNFKKVNIGLIILKSKWFFFTALISGFFANIFRIFLGVSDLDTKFSKENIMYVDWIFQILKGINIYLYNYVYGTKAKIYNKLLLLLSLIYILLLSLYFFSENTYLFMIMIICISTLSSIFTYYFEYKRMEYIQTAGMLFSFFTILMLSYIEISKDVITYNFILYGLTYFVYLVTFAYYETRDYFWKQGRKRHTF